MVSMDLMEVSVILQKVIHINDYYSQESCIIMHEVILILILELHMLKILSLNIFHKIADKDSFWLVLINFTCFLKKMIEFISL